MVVDDDGSGVGATWWLLMSMVQWKWSLMLTWLRFIVLLSSN